MRREPIVTQIEKSVRIGRPLADVFAFYDSPENLRAVTPESSPLEMERLPRDLRPGSIFGYRMRHWLADLRWEALVSEYQPMERVVHVQSHGYFLQWVHEHHFMREGDATRLRVVLRYEMPEGLRGSLLNAIYLRKTLDELLTTRLASVKAWLERSRG